MKLPKGYRIAPYCSNGHLMMEKIPKRIIDNSPTIFQEIIMLIKYVIQRCKK